MDRSISYKNSRSTPPALHKGSEDQVHGVRSIQVSPTPGIRGNNKHSPELTKPTDKRTVKPIEPTSYIRQFYDAAETMLSGGREALNVSKAFFIDLGITTAETFKSAWNSVDQGVPEMLKFTGGVVTLGSALTQATVAGIVEVAEGLGYDVANESVDGVSYLLKQAGIKTTGLTKTELRQLGTSLAALHFGFSQDIHLKNAKFEIKQGSGYKLNISNLQVKNLVPANIGQTDLKESDQLTTSADELSFTLEYLPETGQPTKLNVCIPSPKLRGETNLLMVMGEAAASCCKDLSELFASNSESSLPATDVKQQQGFWDNEKTSIHFDAPGAVIKIEEPGDLLNEYSTPQGSVISFNDLHAHQKRTFMAAGAAEKPDVCFSSMEIDKLHTGALQLKSGFIRLDDDLNGELVCTLLVDYKDLDEYCPSWIPDEVRNAITGTDADHLHAAVRLGIQIYKGEIDLNNLVTSGLKQSGLQPLQKLIQNSFIDTLRSEHTRLRHTSDTGSELKIHLPMKHQKASKKNYSEAAVNTGGTITQRHVLSDQNSLSYKIKNKLKKLNKLCDYTSSNPSYYKTYMKLPETTVFKPESKGRGKISLLNIFNEHIGVSLNTDHKN